MCKLAETCFSICGQLPLGQKPPRNKAPKDPVYLDMAPGKFWRLQTKLDLLKEIRI